jgi:bacteriophage N4 adsorption protein B
MWWVDALATYLYALKAVAIAVALAILISSLDDLIIDIVYWVRRLWRAFTIDSIPTPSTSRLKNRLRS